MRKKFLLGLAFIAFGGCATITKSSRNNLPLAYYFSHSEVSHISISAATEGREFSQQSQGTSFDDVFCIFEVTPHQVDVITSYVDTRNRIKPLPELDPYIDIYGVISKSDETLMVLGHNWVKYWDEKYYGVHAKDSPAYFQKVVSLVSSNNCEVIDVFE